MKDRPNIGKIHISPRNESQSPISQIEFTWIAFDQPGISDDQQLSSPIQRYEWTIMVDNQGVQPRHQLLPWQVIQASSNQVYFKLTFSVFSLYVTSWDKTSHMLYNIKGQKFAFYLKKSKYAHFLFSSQTKYLCMFLSLKLIFCTFLFDFSCILQFLRLYIYRC